MKTFQIEQTVSGVTLGQWEASNESEALDLMAQDQGYKDYAELLSVTGEPRDTHTLAVRVLLCTETNTPAMEKRILKAAHKALNRRNLTAIFEHGQWWIEHLPSGAQWSVNDASGPSCLDGFDFEQVTQGDEE